MTYDHRQIGIRVFSRLVHFPAVGAYLENEEPRPYRRGLLTIQAALDPSLARLGAAHTAEWWLR